MNAKPPDIPFFSIIIPTYNSGKDIVKCLLSVTSQKFQGYEVIIQDGLSSDNTLESVGGIQNLNPRIPINVFAEKDTGVYDAMNKAVHRARGKWIYFLGSDDYLLHENILGQVHEYLSSHENAKMVYGNVIWGYTNEVYAGKFNFEKLLAQNICHQAIFLRKDVLLQYGLFNPAFRCWADWDLNLKLFKSHLPIRYIDITIAYFNIGGTSSNYQQDPFSEVLQSEKIKYSRKISTRIKSRWRRTISKFKS